MSDGIRYAILQVLVRDGMKTIEDLQESCNEPNRKRMYSNIKAGVNDGLIERGRDEVTGQPGYVVTPSGRARLAASNQQFNDKPLRENVKGRAKKADPAPATETDTAQAVDATIMKYIYDIRCAIGDQYGKIMLGDLAGVIQERMTQLASVEDIAMQHGILRTKLDIGPDDDVICAVDTLLARIEARPNPSAPALPGKLAMLLIDSLDMTEIEEMASTTLDAAVAEARRKIEGGFAARAVVMTIHGEAQRRVEWKAAA